MSRTPPEPSVDDYMAHLARELKPLPAAARDEHLRELRQHVEQLIAARAGQPDAVQGALSQMGNAKQVGRRLAGEWRFQHTQKAGRYFPFYWLTRSLVGLFCSQWILHIQNTQPSTVWGGTHFVLYDSVMELTVALVSSLVIGWLAPGCAFRMAFYSGLFFTGEPYVSALVIYGRDISFFRNGYFYQKDAYSTTVVPLLAPLTVAASFAMQCGVSYLVSAYRRGELYRLQRADFRIPNVVGAWRRKLANMK